MLIRLEYNSARSEFRRCGQGEFPLKISFITSCLEPGRDGVGDYTSGLADELRLQGHDVLVIALQDRFVNEVISAERQIEGGSVRTLRLPSRWAWAGRIRRAGQELDSFDPDWVSLQFVCYAFHPKGLVHGLASKLAPLLKGRKLHVMFHEIWLCKELGWGWKQCAVGALQRHMIQHFVDEVKPNLMHTSNATYAALLNRSGIRVTELSLFGNVPILSEPRTTWIESQLRGVLGDAYRRESVWLFGFFGAIHSQWPPEPLLTRLCRAAQAAGKKPVILSIGRTGAPGLELWNRLSRDYAAHFAFAHLGEQPALRVSEFLSYLDFGIATTPRSILGKSGTVAAMLEHGVPVIVNRNDRSVADGMAFTADMPLVLCDASLEKRLGGSIKKVPSESRRPKVARGLVSALLQAA
jgi:hypothetical protein